MKEYTLDDAQAVSNDLSDISLFLNSESCQNNEELRAVVWERMQSQVENLQGILSWLEMAPTVKSHWEEADKLKTLKKSTKYPNPQVRIMCNDLC